ncbi:MAG: SLC13 family permease [Chloroflexi bacterium]|nr:SLC13 family permease [Chloroflexota bacterium]
MIPSTITLAIILACAFGLMLTNRLRPDVIAICVALALGISGVITPNDVFSGFSRSAVITILGIFILTQGLYRTGVTRAIGIYLARVSGGGERRMILLVMLAGATLSLVMNNIAAAAMLLPATVDAVKRAHIAPSKVMIPLAFATALGGMATLFTTSNIVVSATLRDQGFNGYGVLDFAPVGIPIVIAGISFMLLAGRRLLPNTDPARQIAAVAEIKEKLAESYQLRERLNEVRIPRESALLGRTIAQSRIGEKWGLSVLAILRGKRSILAPAASEVIEPNDVLLIVGRNERVQKLEQEGAIVEPEARLDGNLVSAEVSLVEVIPAPRSRAVGQSLRQLHFREKFGASVVALWHGGRSVRTDLADLPLQYGDSLLVHGPNEAIRLLQADPDFLVLRADSAEPAIGRKAWLSAGIMAATLALATTGLLPVAETVVLGAMAMVLTGCLTMDEAYRAVEWRAVFLIAGMLPVSIAMVKTGTADLLGQGLVNALAGYGPLAVGAGLLLLTALLTQVMSGQVTAVVLAPIAISAAQIVGADPRAMAMFVAMGSSLVYITPTAHPVNVFVMGPGGYSASDYPRVGLPLTVLLFIVIMIVVPLVFRL